MRPQAVPYSCPLAPLAGLRACVRAPQYGQRALVNENVGSLVNTLMLHKSSDLRLEAFAKLLSEEWDVGVFIDFLNAQTLAVQVTPMCLCGGGSVGPRPGGCVAGGHSGWVTCTRPCEQWGARHGMTAEPQA